MPASNAASVQARVCSNATPPENVSQEPREISETSRSEEPSLRYLIWRSSVTRRAHQPLSGVKLADGKEALLGDGDGDRPNAGIAARQDAEAPRDPDANPRLEHRGGDARPVLPARDRVESHGGRLTGVGW